MKICITIQIETDNDAAQLVADAIRAVLPARQPELPKSAPTPFSRPENFPHLHYVERRRRTTR